MENRSVKTALGLFFFMFMGMMFISSKFAYATTGLIYSNTVSGGSDYNQYNYFLNIDTTQLATSTGRYIKYVKLKIRVDQSQLNTYKETYPDAGSFAIKPTLLTDTGGITQNTVCASNEFTADYLASASEYKEVTFEYSSDTANTLNSIPQHMYLAFNGYGCGSSDIASKAYIKGSNIQTVDGRANVIFDYNVTLYDDSYIPLSTTGGTNNIAKKDYSTNFVDFADPPYTNGLFTPDFKNWMACYNIVNGAAGSSYGFDIVIDYGTSTPDLWQDSIYSALGSYAPLPRLPDSGCPIISKQATSTPGDYVALATLLRHSPITGTSTIATSSLFHFTVISGTAVDYPGQFQNHIACPETDFKLNFNITTDPLGSFYTGITGGSLPWYNASSSMASAIDFGQGICKISDYLISPSQESLNLFGDLWDSISKKPPLGWFTVTQSTLSGINASSTPAVVLQNLDLLGNVKTALDDAVALLVIVSFGFFMLHRFRKFDFHI